MNQNTKHTPGPWTLGETMPVKEGKYHMLAAPISAGGQAIARVWMGPDDGMRSGFGNEEANARRIVACVNALEGVSTEDLESGAFKKEIARTLAQRDELLAVRATATEQINDAVNIGGKWYRPLTDKEVAHVIWDAPLTERQPVADDIRLVLEAFDNGIFVRNHQNDSNPGWAISLLPYIGALGRLKEIVDTTTPKPAEGSPQ